MIPLRASEPRPDEQIVGGWIPVAWGGESRMLPVLSIRENRAWSAKFTGAIKDRLPQIGKAASVDDVVALFLDSMDTMVDLLLAYDRDGVLGDKEWVDSHVTDREVYESMKRVTAAAFPFDVDLRTMVPELVPAMLGAAKRLGLAMKLAASSPPTNGSATNTAAPRRKRSKRPTPTSS